MFASDKYAAAGDDWHIKPRRGVTHRHVLTLGDGARRSHFLAMLAAVITREAAR